MFDSSNLCLTIACNHFRLNQILMIKISNILIGYELNIYSP
jgi:hypothetical protein